MKTIGLAVLIVCLNLGLSSSVAAQERVRYRVPQAARSELIRMRADVHHGSAGGAFTADLTPAQVESLRRSGFDLVAVPVLVPGSGAGGSQALAGGWTPYAQMRADFMASAASHPTIAEYRVIGHSVQGREIFGLRISDNVQLEEDEPEMVFWANIHGDEFASGEIAYQYALELIDGYGSDPEATQRIDDLEIWVIPLLNPDGHELGTRNNANGVDLNRDLGWNWDGWGGSPSPYSQVETQALQQFCQDNNVSLSSTMHCSGNVFLYPWCHSPHDVPEETLVREVGFLYSNAANYQLLNSWSDYETHGELLDLVHGGHGALCYTAEISNSLAQYANSYSRNRAGMDAFCDVAGQGLHGLVTDAQSGLPLQAQVFISGSEYPAYSDPAVGDVHRIVLPGTYDITVRANGYLPETILGVQVLPGGTTQFAAALQPGGGRHAFFVSAVDQRDPNNAYANLSSPSDALGAPDGAACSLGSEGFIVLDVGAGHAVTDGPGDDLTVTEAVVPGDTGPEPYSVFVGGAFEQGILLGSAVGTASFDLGSVGVASTRYIRIQAGVAPAVNAPLAGMELDAITVLNGPGGAFVDLGPSGLPGLFGEPAFSGAGDLTPGSLTGFALSCAGAQPSTLGFLFFGFAPTAPVFPFFGGTFYPFPYQQYVIVPFDGAGELFAPGAIDAAVPPGTSVAMQFFFLDGSAVQGVSGSNGLRIDVP
jgi:hypothetical protein